MGSEDAIIEGRGAEIEHQKDDGLTMPSLGK